MYINVNASVELRTFVHSYTCRHELNTIVYLLPENHDTDKIQPIDAGFGKMLKTKIGQEMDKWLEEKDNLELWHDRGESS